MKRRALIAGGGALVAAAMLAASGCAPSARPQDHASDDPEPTPNEDKPVLSYLALGDSYTIGEAVAETGRWPVQLAAMLSERGTPVASPTLIAKTGWTTDELSAQMDRVRLTGPFDLASLLIGVNNQYRGRDLASYRGEFAALLERTIGLAGGRAERTFVLSIPDWGVTPFGIQSGRDRAQIARELDAYNAAAHEIAAARGVAFVDITAISRNGTDPAAFFADDGLHPSAAQYRAWAEAALPAVEALVAKD